MDKKRSSSSINQKRIMIRQVTETGFSSSGEYICNMSMQQVSKHDERYDIKVSAAASCMYPQ